ncbi:MAG: TetR/AcrR family transcriptional regulator [Acidobacteria bacterium]|nr:TetR/AcrR family transcriptional regulator [Acidobacteriota bacterium]
MGVQERRAREKQELRQEILDAARDLFVREGFDNVSMRKIAEKIEYSATTIYLYFLDKADLLDCIVEETFQRLETRMATIHSSVPDPRERLIAGLRAYIDFGVDHPSDYRVAFLVERKGYETGYPRCSALGQKLLDHVRQSVADCIRHGIFPVVDIEAVSQTLWAAVHGMTSLLILRADFAWAPRDILVDQLIDTLMKGLECHQRACGAA